jgi:hypothetical protein
MLTRSSTAVLRGCVKKALSQAKDVTAQTAGTLRYTRILMLGHIFLAERIDENPDKRGHEAI